MTLPYKKKLIEVAIPLEAICAKVAAVEACTPGVLQLGNADLIRRRRKGARRGECARLQLRRVHLAELESSRGDLTRVGLDSSSHIEVTRKRKACQISFRHFDHRRT